MKKIQPTVILDVGALTQRLLEQKIMRTRFRLPCTEEQARAFLTAAYRSEVAYRNRNYIDSEAVNNHINRLAQFLTDEGSQFGVLLCGTYGNGKTTLLYALSSVIHFLKMNGYLDMHTNLRIYDSRKIAKLYRDRDPEVFEDACREPLLAIEDMGKEPTETLDYGNIISPVIELLEQRYDAQLFTAITTNLTPKEIRAKYGNRIADRFNEMMCVLNFGATDTFRKLK